MPSVADTSFVYAVAVATELDHQACVAIHNQQDVIYLPQSTLAEVGYLLTREGGNRAAAQFLMDLPKSKYRIEALLPEDFQRTAEILFKYADSRVDFVDATIAAVAERKRIIRILTLDQRDFQILRPNHTDHFELLP
jgi:predicted nucleic acid-binding protein